jgi:hypothetical protein
VPESAVRWCGGAEVVIRRDGAAHWLLAQRAIIYQGSDSDALLLSYCVRRPIPLLHRYGMSGTPGRLALRGCRVLGGPVCGSEI